MSTLLYDGYLDKDTLDWIKMADGKGLTHVVELNSNWLSEPCANFENWRDWQEKNLVRYPRTSEDCMGNNQHDTCHSYMTFGINGDSENGVFIFFASKPEKDAFLRDYASCVKTASPFVSIVRGFRADEVEEEMESNQEGCRPITGWTVLKWTGAVVILMTLAYCSSNH